MISSRDLADDLAGGRTAAMPPSNAKLLFVPFVIGSLVAVTLGVYGNLHTPTGIAVSVAGFSSPLTVKVWLATGSAVFAVVQLLSASSMYGLFGPGSPAWTGTLHRWSGRIAFLLAVPVVVHCLYALGFSTYDFRTLVHSIAGCFFFGVFTVKMLALPKKGLSGWVLPVLGGLAFTALIALWLTSSFWYFTTSGIRF